MNIKTDNGEILYYAAVLCQLVDELNETFSKSASLSNRVCQIHERIPKITQMKGLLERSLRRRYDLEKSKLKKA